MYRERERDGKTRISSSGKFVLFCLIRSRAATDFMRLKIPPNACEKARQSDVIKTQVNGPQNHHSDPSECRNPFWFKNKNAKSFTKKSPSPINYKTIAASKLARMWLICLRYLISMFRGCRKKDSAFFSLPLTNLELALHERDVLHSQCQNWRLCNLPDGLY